MSLSEKAKNPRPAAYSEGPIDRWLNTLTPEERDAALHMLRTPKRGLSDVNGWTLLDLLDEFRDEGFVTSKETLGRWRRLNGVTR